MDTSLEGQLHSSEAVQFAKIPTLAVMGEFSSGKSSLINLLLNEDLLPTQVTATQVPAVILEHGTSISATARTRDGSEENIGERNPFLLDYEKYTQVRAQRPYPVLRHMNIADTPGISDPLLASGALDEFGDLADLVLWCTHATQAWRESESSFWRALPDRLHKSSILVVTRADLLKPTEVERVRTRLEQETKGLFRKIVFLSTLLAKTALKNPDWSASEEQWKLSGGHYLFSLLNLDRKLIDRVLINQDENLKIENSRKKVKNLCKSKLQGLKNHSVEKHRSALIAIYYEHQPLLVDTSNSIVEQTQDLAKIIQEDLGEEVEHLSPDEESMKRLRMLANTVAKKVAVLNPTSAHEASDVSANPMEGLMATDITSLKDINGFIGACLVDSDTGLMLASEGGGAKFDLDTAAAGNTEVVKAKLQVMDALGLDDKIEDILITLGTQFHLVRPLEDTPTVFLYVALDKKSANLGMARIQVKKLEATLSI